VALESLERNLCYSTLNLSSYLETEFLIYLKLIQLLLSDLILLINKIYSLWWAAVILIKTVKTKVSLLFTNGEIMEWRANVNQQRFYQKYFRHQRPPLTYS